jgi:site-specific DNA-methyltransferase (adenine-specific)
MVRNRKAKDWDNEIPKAEYWEQLFRVSKNQIVWGGNYFELPKPTKCWVIWDKNNGDKTFNFSHGELAWTSFNKQPMKVTKSSWRQIN